MKSFITLALLSTSACLVTAKHHRHGKRAAVEGQEPKRMNRRSGHHHHHRPLLVVSNATLVDTAHDTTLNSTATPSNATVEPTSYNGTALWFHQDGSKSACLTVHNNDDFVVGLSDEWWSDTTVPSPYCGQYMNITYGDKSVVALISDASGKIYTTLTEAAFLALAPLIVGEIPVTYTFLNATLPAASSSAASSVPSSASPSSSGSAAASSSASAIALVALPATISTAPVTTSPSSTPKPNVAPTTTSSYDSESAASVSSASAYEASKSAASAQAEASSKSAASAQAEASSKSAAAAQASATAAQQAQQQQQAQQAQQQANAKAFAQKSAEAAAAASSQAAEQAAASAAAQQAYEATKTTAAPVVKATVSVNTGGQKYTGGQGTYFTQNGVAGACGKVNLDTAKVIAIDSAMYNNGANCGRSITITRVSDGRTATGVVADECPTCNNGTSLDMSEGLFLELGTYDEGEFDIEWSFN
ncbi:hypothetical protein P7C70_g6334, partial [Phenoliferia sp. Uapishka_3]